MTRFATLDGLPNRSLWDLLLGETSHLQQSQLEVIRSIDHQILTNFTDAVTCRREFTTFLGRLIEAISETYTLKSGTAVLFSRDATVLLFGVDESLESRPIELVGALVTESAKSRAFYSGNDLYCIAKAKDELFLLLCFHDPVIKRSDKERMISFLNVVANQLSVFLVSSDQSAISECQLAVSRVFFDRNLQPSGCWQGLVDEFDKFLPDWKGIIPSPPAIQLLTYDASSDVLRIVATKRSHGISRQLRPGDSAIGLLLESDARILLLSPQKEAARYKTFSGKKMHSELMIRLEHNDRTFGVLNLEHEEDNAFNGIYVRYAKMLACVLGPFIGGLTSRFAAYRDKELTLLYTFGRTLERLGQMYGHLVEQPVSGIGTGVSELEYQLAENTKMDNAEVKKQLHIIRRSFEGIRKQSQAFVESMPSYLHFAPFPVKDTIKRRLRALNKLQQERIDIRVIGNKDYTVYASRIFQEHIYNLVNNSVQAVQERVVEKSVGRGKIEIRVRRVVEKDMQKRSTGISFAVISISDNGGGVPEDWLENVGILGMSTKENGSGFGVAAAKEYFEAIGGAVSWKNLSRDGGRVGFEIVARVQIFDQDRHITGSPAELYRRSQSK